MLYVFREFHTLSAEVGCRPADYFVCSSSRMSFGDFTIISAGQVSGKTSGCVHLCPQFRADVLSRRAISILG